MSSLHMSVQDRLAKSAAERTVGKKVDLAPTVQEAFEYVYGSRERADNMIRKHFYDDSSPMARRIQKDLGAVDVTSLRLISLSDRSPVLRNEDTKFLNFLESQGRYPRIMDYQFRIRERHIVSNVSGPFNPDGDLPAVKQSSRPARTNTLTFVGNTIKISFMANELASQQADVTLMAEEVDDEIIRIRKTMASMLLSNVEQVVEAPGFVPQLGGFINRSIFNTVTVSGGNMTDAYIQQGVRAIRLALGSGKQNILWLPPAQVSVIDNLMITRYPGENSMARFERQELAARLANFNVPWENVYIPRPGKPIPVVFDDQLPDATGLMFTWEKNLYPRMPKFQMFGQNGPWILARPNATLYELVLVCDSFSLDDPIREGRVVYTGLNSADGS